MRTGACDDALPRTARKSPRRCCCQRLEGRPGGFSSWHRRASREPSWKGCCSWCVDDMAREEREACEAHRSSRLAQRPRCGACAMRRRAQVRPLRPLLLGLAWGGLWACSVPLRRAYRTRLLMTVAWRPRGLADRICLQRFLPLVGRTCARLSVPHPHVLRMNPLTTMLRCLSTVDSTIGQRVPSPCQHTTPSAAHARHGTLVLWREGLRTLERNYMT